jgi:response regulator NasT
VAADDEPNMGAYYEHLLTRLGHQVVVARGGRQLLEQCRAFHPDLVITDIRMPDLDGLAAAAEINRVRAVPVILVTAHYSPELHELARQDHIMAYLVKPVKQADLEMAIELAVMRAEQFGALRREAADLRQALEDRKAIERAKGIVMRRLRVDEPAAFQLIQRLSSAHNLRLADTAQKVVEADEIYQALEGTPAPH